MMTKKFYFRGNRKDGVKVYGTIEEVTRYKCESYDPAVGFDMSGNYIFSGDRVVQYFVLFNNHGRYARAGRRVTKDDEILAVGFFDGEITFSLKKGWRFENIIMRNVNYDKDKWKQKLFEENSMLQMSNPKKLVSYRSLVVQRGEEVPLSPLEHLIHEYENKINKG